MFSLGCILDFRQARGFEIQFTVGGSGSIPPEKFLTLRPSVKKEFWHSKLKSVLVMHHFLFKGFVTSPELIISNSWLAHDIIIFQNLTLKSHQSSYSHQVFDSLNLHLFTTFQFSSLFMAVCDIKLPTRLSKKDILIL